MSKILKVKLTQNTTGSGIIDKSIVDILKEINDPIPYLRGLLAELSKINLLVNHEKKGISSNNLFSLTDVAILGVIKQSKAPLVNDHVDLISLISFVCAIIFFTKVVSLDRIWNGWAPLIGLFAIWISNLVSWILDI